MHRHDLRREGARRQRRNEEWEKRRCELAHGHYDEATRHCEPFDEGGKIFSHWLRDVDNAAPGGTSSRGFLSRLRAMREVLTDSNHIPYMASHWYRHPTELYSSWSPEQQVAWETAALATAFAQLATEETPREVIVFPHGIEPVGRNFDGRVNSRIQFLRGQRQAREQERVMHSCHDNRSEDFCVAGGALCHWDNDHGFCGINRDLTELWTLVERACVENDYPLLRDLLNSMYDEGIPLARQSDPWSFLREVIPGSRVNGKELCDKAIVGYAFLEAIAERDGGTDRWHESIKDDDEFESQAKQLYDEILDYLSELDSGGWTLSSRQRLEAIRPLVVEKMDSLLPPNLL